MNPERRLKKLMSDRYENMSEERRIKKKEVSRVTFLLRKSTEQSLEICNCPPYCPTYFNIINSAINYIETEQPHTQ
jgi:hypothetical protein